MSEDCAKTTAVDDARKVQEYGLRQLEWDHGGQFVDSNRVVDRHNREIVSAYEMGLGTAESLVRDLARIVKFMQWGGFGYGKSRCPICGGRTGHGSSCDVGKMLSRIPDHLRAPEATSTGESRSVLRQEELK